MKTVKKELDEIVVPNFRDYDRAETALTEAWKVGDAKAMAAASNAALRSGMNAATAVYHLSDAVWLAHDRCRGLRGLRTRK